MNSKLSPMYINTLKKNEVFVFGSNLSGLHGAGAARKALEFGAKLGIGVGLVGSTYAIPTKDFGILRTLKIEEIKPYVDEFISFAKSNPSLCFLVTEVGCGLAGYTTKDIAPLFLESMDVDNIKLPLGFYELLKKE